MTRSVPFSIGRFETADGASFTAVVIDGRAVPLSTVMPSLTANTTLDDLLEEWPEQWKSLKRSVAEYRGFENGLRAADLKALSPICRPRQIFCAGANYGRHLVEMMVAVGLGQVTDGMSDEEKRTFGEEYLARQRREADPYVFMAPVTALAGPQDDFVLPEFSEKMDWEVELGVVLGAPAYRVKRDEALKVVAGYVVVNDLTARDKVKRSDPGAIGPDWIAAKGGPGFLPVGPLFAPAEFVRNPHDLSLKLSVNGQVMQDDRTSDMTFGIDRQIEHISTYAKMLPGDLLCTGSPAGNGIARGVFLKSGDVIEAEVDGLGRQTIRCVESTQKMEASAKRKHPEVPGGRRHPRS